MEVDVEDVCDIRASSGVMPRTWLAGLLESRYALSHEALYLPFRGAERVQVHKSFQRS